jgi:hypothetical protein
VVGFFQEVADLKYNLLNGGFEWGFWSFCVYLPFYPSYGRRLLLNQRRVTLSKVSFTAELEVEYSELKSLLPLNKINVEHCD